MGEGPDLPGDLRLLGRAAAAGAGHTGPGHLLGLHEGQPAPPELHIEDPPRLFALPPLPSFPSVANAPPLSPDLPGRRQDGFKRKRKRKNTKKTIFI